MSEVDKLYENVGIKKEVIPCPAKYYGYNCTRNNWDDEDCSCDIEGYPPFTAEKQIELIKWLSSKHGIYIVNVDKYSIGFGMCIGDFCTKENFEEALAESINSLWQDLTPKEKQQVKGILK